jgi:hypothetical protein
MPIMPNCSTGGVQRWRFLSATRFCRQPSLDRHRPEVQLVGNLPDAQAALPHFPDALETDGCPADAAEERIDWTTRGKIYYLPDRMRGLIGCIERRKHTATGCRSERADLRRGGLPSNAGHKNFINIFLVFSS